MRLHRSATTPQKRRIGAVAERLDLPFTTSAASRVARLRKVLAERASSPTKWPCGDRLFTDVLAGNRLAPVHRVVEAREPQGQPCQPTTCTAEFAWARWISTRLDDEHAARCQGGNEACCAGSRHAAPMP